MAGSKTFEITDAEAGIRLDVVLQRLMPETSRSRIQQWIKAGEVTVDGAAAKANAELKAGQRVEVHPQPATPLHAFAEDIPLEILYEDEHLVAVNKPAGMVVHLGAGQHEGTLVNALLHRYGSLAQTSDAERPGIVHRIDKDTSGVLLVARTDAAHRALADQFESRKIGKTYLALAEGAMPAEEGTIDRAITRDPHHRTRMTARLGHGRKSITQYCVRRRFSKHTLLEVRILTGRTHQIRAHMSAIGHPIAGDTLYGGHTGPELPSGRERFFLHAHRIEFTHPATGERITVEAPLAPELEAWLRSLN